MAQKTHRVSFAPKLTGANLPVEARTGPAGEVILGHSPAIHSGHSHFTEASSLGDPKALCIAMVHQEISIAKPGFDHAHDLECLECLSQRCAADAELAGIQGQSRSDGTHKRIRPSQLETADVPTAPGCPQKVRSYVTSRRRSCQPRRLSHPDSAKPFRETAVEGSALPSSDPSRCTMPGQYPRRWDTHPGISKREVRKADLWTRPAAGSRWFALRRAFGTVWLGSRDTYSGSTQPWSRTLLG
jgi:hypothetical protein